MLLDKILLPGVQIDLSNAIEVEIKAEKVNFSVVHGCK